MFDSDSNFLCIAHRGASGHEPENTILSIKKALELGAGAVEIDVHHLHNELFVTHDTVIHDPQKGPVDLAQCTLQQIKSVNAGKGQKIPTLEEVISFVDARVFLNLELKNKGTAVSVCNLIKRFVKQKKWPESRFILSSFDIQELETVRSINPDITTGVLLNCAGTDFVRLAARVRARFIGVDVHCIEPAMIKTAHENNLKVLVYTVNGREQISRIKSMGVDGIFTDFPEQCTVFMNNAG